MIIGNGDIASVLKHKDQPGRLFFASGVSNPREGLPESEYQREKDLLKKQRRDWQIVYFSTLRVFDPTETRYIKHKKEMESLVKKFPSHVIIRMGTITWGKTNPYTLLNFLRGVVARNEPLQIRNTSRYITDKTEFLRWIDLIPSWNCEINITGHRMREIKIFRKFVSKDYPVELPARKTSKS